MPGTWNDNPLLEKAGSLVHVHIIWVVPVFGPLTWVRDPWQQKQCLIHSTHCFILRAILYHPIHYSILCYSILFYTILYYTIPYHTAPHHTVLLHCNACYTIRAQWIFFIKIEWNTNKTNNSLYVYSKTTMRWWGSRKMELWSLWVGGSANFQDQFGKLFGGSSYNYNYDPAVSTLNMYLCTLEKWVYMSTRRLIQ